MHIALLEDNTDIAEMVTNLLELVGYCVSAYSSGSALLKALFPDPELARNYDLAIVDLNLPGMQGMDVIAAIRQTHRVLASQLPIVVTSEATQEIAHVESRFPGIPVVRKPFHARELLQVITTMFEPQQ